jgi:uncharacterized membrane protein YphA (DoxX/SURF4 family)
MLKDLGLLALRVVSGGLLTGHGGQKLFGWFGGYGLVGTGEFLASVGFHPGVVGLALTAIMQQIAVQAGQHALAELLGRMPYLLLALLAAFLLLQGLLKIARPAPSAGARPGGARGGGPPGRGGGRRGGRDRRGALGRGRARGGVARPGGPCHRAPGWPPRRAPPARRDAPRPRRPPRRRRGPRQRAGRVHARVAARLHHRRGHRALRCHPR